jgi:hypothetical protein
MGKGSVKIYKKRYKKKHNTRKQNRGNKKNKTKKSFIKLNCSPKNTKKEYTCYSDDDLYKLRDMWNARHPDSPIKTQNTKKIWEQLKEYYATICNKESCWVRKMTKDSKLEKELLSAFAPESPKQWKKNPNEWLSSVDIMKVMKQYEKAYKCFDFMGPTPINFDTKKLYGECVWEELCNFSLKEQIKHGKNKIGIIFNTDPHNKPGQHWISMFINIKKKTIFFFDSTGDPAPREVKNLINRIKEQGLKLKPTINFKLDSNEGIEHQYGNTECGIYSIFFIVHMLEDKMTEHYLKTHILKDEYMEKFRHIYFNDSL